ncbi:alpha/beta fold hydrolase [Ensifer sp. LCM 4579]|uniref:alpha/beta fold hydrolase n=1 Tax=Ensifer sp. LCM 4579 TaxID=1848292 RepID=UPI0008DA9F6B|nr:alpha/beta hydrolase [Ensifer sp. LCM 4579]OHV72658.1 hydrolase [Ensifer sp. LCM 4579]
MGSVEDEWDRRKRRVELPGDRPIAFVDSGGSGPPLLLLHGYSDTGRSFYPLEPFLAGYRLIVPDLPGHGASAVGDGMRVSDFATSIDGLLAMLGVSQIAVIGHSMGAMTAIELAARRRDDVRALVLLSASLRPDFGSKSPLSCAIRALRDPIDPAGRFLRDWYSCSRPVEPAFLSKMRVDAAAMPAAVWHCILEGFAKTDLRRSAMRVTAPVLCIGGSADPLFDGSHREALAHAFPSARSITLDGYGHNPHWEDPERVAALMVSFIAEAGTACYCSCLVSQAIVELC